MSEVVGVAEVIVRPVTTGFAAEARSGIQKEGRDIGRDLSKAILAGFAIGGVVEGIKSVVEAATKQNTAFAVLDRTLKDAGQSVKGFSASLHDTLEEQARKSGISAEDLAQAMTRIVSATHDSAKALRDLGIAQDLSRQRGVGLATVALALSKAETGSYTSLQRYIGLIPKVTTAQDALKGRYQELINSGTKLDAAQKAQYASALAVAVAADKAATAQGAIALAQQKSAGSAAAFAASYQGQFDRLHVAVEQLKVAVGTELVGGLARGAGALADWIDKLVASDRVQEQVHRELQTLRGDFEAIRSVASTVGGPLLTLADHLGGVAKSLQALALVLAAGKLAGGLTATSVAETAAAASTDAYTAALVANTAAIEANTAAQGGGAVAGIVKTGEAAATAAGKVSLLRTSLARLALIGAIAIPIEILLNKDAIDKSVSGFLDKHGLPGGSNNLTAQQAVNQYGQLKHVFGQKTADELYDLGTQAGGKSGFVGGLISGVQNSLNSITSTGVFGGGIGGIAGIVSGAFDSQKALDAAVKKKASVAAAAKNAALAATEQTLRDSIASDKIDITTIQQNLADAIEQGAQAVIDAVNQAKQNLNSIGSSLSTEIQAILVKPITDAQQQISEAQNKLSLATSKTTLRNLGQSVLLPGGKQLSSDPQRAIAQLQALEKKTSSPALAAFIQQYQSAFLSERSAGVTVAGDRITREGQTAQRRIETLTDQFNNKRIGKGQLTTGIKGVLSNLGITGASASAVLGPLGGDTVQALVKGITEQAGAIAGGPQRAGNGLVPSITRPLQTLEQTTRQINQLRHEEFLKEHDEQKKQTKLLTDIANGKRADAFTSSLSKNPGSGSKRTQALTGTTR